MHLRIENTILATLHSAITLNIPIFQCFLINQTNKRYIVLNKEVIDQWCMLKTHHAIEVIIHAAYWINIAQRHNNSSIHILRHEIELAQRLGCSTLVLHPGTAKGFETKHEGILQLAKALNSINKQYPTITILLENTCHKHSIGSDIQDFFEILPHLDYPERVRFCIDTAHAFAYGYDLVTPQGIKDFIERIATTIGWPFVSLIHLNDSQRAQGSFIDYHALIGDGCIGFKPLMDFINNAAVNNKNIIIESPKYSLQEQCAIIAKIKHYIPEDL